MVVRKVLRSMGAKFNHVVTAVEESKDITKLTLDVLTGPLKAHEARLISQADHVEEKVLHVRGEAPTSVRESKRAPQRGRGRSSFKGAGYGRGRARGAEHKLQIGEQRRFRSDVQCHLCKKYGHIKANCWFKEKPADKGASLVVEKKEKETSNLFLAHSEGETSASSFILHSNSEKNDVNMVWIIDSGCLNHMTGVKEMFETLDESLKHSVRLGDDKEISVIGQGTIAIKAGDCRMKLLHNVQYVPGLAYNFLGVGQLLDDNNLVVF
ncbi:RNA-directed DNA polymerase protein [Dioscorea alata]|uniref:RNA-directed DNA polymerase protein n=1 Tax=Dioscorea alata TaxID=55571 RepID=A0ACB7V1Q6_DIOAL|nr:RNA-directed DNA polymerase protein [Dioscorea alata]